MSSSGTYLTIDRESFIIVVLIIVKIGNSVKGRLCLKSHINKVQTNAKYNLYSLLLYFE